MEAFTIIEPQVTSSEYREEEKSQSSSQQEEERKGTSEIPLTYLFYSCSRGHRF